MLFQPLEKRALFFVIQHNAFVVYAAMNHHGAAFAKYHSNVLADRRAFLHHSPPCYSLRDSQFISRELVSVQPSGGLRYRHLMPLKRQ